jgi:hypothetical protein
MFHLVSGVLPFDCSSPIVASISIAGDMNSKAVDVRDVAPENLRSNISSAFAQVLAKGLEKKLERRYQSVDEMASALHGCLVQRGEDIYTVFISYRVFSEKYHAMLLYELLNNTATPAGHRVIVYLDAKRLVKGEDWEEGFSLGLLNSLVALPLVSEGVLLPMTKLQGTASDKPDNVAKELMIMQAIQGHSQKLKTIYPILIGKPVPEDDSHYPGTGNFFAQSGHLVERLIDVPSPPTTDAVLNFLQKRCPAVLDTSGDIASSVRSSVQNILAKQGAQLWSLAGSSLPAEEELLADHDTELWSRVLAEPPNPPLDLKQLHALKVGLRALIPGIHEVIDRSFLGFSECTTR